MVTKTLPIAEELNTFDDYLKYGTDEETSKGLTTRRAYCWTMELFHHFLDGREPTPELGKEFVRELEGKGNSPSSINRHIWALKSYFRFRIASGIPGAKEFKIRGLKTQEYKPRFLRDKEWEKLLSTATNPINDPELSSYARRRAKLELALLYAYCGAGLRCSEAINLKMDDLGEGFIRVIRKGGREDFVPVEDEVLRGIKDYIESREQKGQYVFPGKVPDTPMAARTAQGIIKNLCKRAGLPDVHIHSLRHTAGYQLRKAGAAERDIQDFLGHKNISTTKIYTHLVNEDLRQRLPKRFAQARQGKLKW